MYHIFWIFNRPWFPRVFKAIINSKILIRFPLCSSVFLVTSVRLKGLFKSTCVTTKCYLKIFEVFSGAFELEYLYWPPMNFPLTKLLCHQRGLSWVIRSKGNPPRRLSKELQCHGHLKAELEGSYRSKAMEGLLTRLLATSQLNSLFTTTWGQD